MAKQKQLRMIVLVGVLLVFFVLVFALGFSTYLGARLTVPVARRVPIAQGRALSADAPGTRVLAGPFSFQIPLAGEEREWSF